jgi:hypothetical protein
MEAMGIKAWTGANDGICKVVANGTCRNSSGLTENVAINSNKLSSADSLCTILTSSPAWPVKCADTTTKILEDLGNQIWNANSPIDANCKAAQANNCRKTGANQGVEEAVALSPTAFKGRKSANDAECADTTTACMTATTGVIVPFDATPSFQAWNATNNKTCVTLVASKCRATDKFTQTSLNNDGTAIRTSDTVAVCANAGSNDKCIIEVGTPAVGTYWETFDDAAAPFKAMTGSGDKRCVTLTDGKCRKASGD